MKDKTGRPVSTPFDSPFNLTQSDFEQRKLNLLPIYSTLKVPMIDGPLSPMILTGGVITEGTAGTITISALTALLRSADTATSPLIYVTLAEQANKTMAAADTKYYVVLTSTPAILIQAAVANGTTEIGIGTCMKEADGTVHFQNAGMRLQNGVAKLHRRAATLRESELASGGTISDAGEASREFNIAKGVVYHGITRLTPFADAPYNPYDSGDDKFTYVYRDGADSWSFTADSTVINNTQYYDGAYALATLGPNKYACHWVYIHPDDMDVYVVFGTSNGKLAEAEQEQPPGDLPDVISNFGMLLGCIIIKKSATAFTTIQMVSDLFFTGTAVADHGSLGGLDDIADHPYAALIDGTRAFTGDQSMGSNKLTSVKDPTANQDATTKKYVDAGVSAAFGLDGGSAVLTDVTLTGHFDLGGA